MNESADCDRNPVEVLADEFAARFRRGEFPSVSEYTQRYPQHADEIAEMFPPIVMMEQLKRRENSDRDEIHRKTKFKENTPERIGDFDILREVGRGGMGVVYEAVQRSLGRRVALKLLTANTISSPKQLQRFHREARAAAGLHHTNIVPVFGVGEQDGMYYYVMQFIHGAGLDSVIDQLRTATATRRHELAPPVEFSLSAFTAAEALLDGRFARQGRTGSASHASQSHGSHVHESGSRGSESDVNDSRSKPLPSLGSVSDAASVVPRTTSNGNQSSSSQLQVKHDRPAAVNLNHVTEVTKGDTSKEIDVRADAPLPRDDRPHGTDGQSSAESSHIATETVEPQSAQMPTGRRLGPRYWKSVARIGQQVADALRYAHAHRVVHRDIKPANLVLDTAGIVWITDFGLAKHSEHENLTHTGDIVGTLRYMAPEQFSGRADERVDIFSLGLTLYEMTTLRPAFDADNRQQLIQQVTQCDPTRPRSINPNIPRELETIILKAIAVDPKDRYPSAGRMADDLGRFLDDLPIRARRHTSIERLWRWSRRNPALAALSGTAIVLLVLVAVVATIGNLRTSAALENAETERQNAHQAASQALVAKQRAEENLSLAIEAFENIAQRVRARAIPQSMELNLDSSEVQSAALQATLTPADADLLRALMKFYLDFAQRNHDDTRLQTKTAEAHRRVGEIEMRLGQFDEAAVAYQNAIEIYSGLAAKFPKHRLYIAEMAGTWNEMGVAAAAGGRIREAVDAHLKARDLLHSQPSSMTYTPEVRFELARSCNLLGSVSIRSGLRSAQLTSAEESVPRDRPSPPDREPRPDRNETFPGETTDERRPSFDRDPRRSRPPDADEDFDDPITRRINENFDIALALLTDLIAEDPNNEQYALTLAQCHRNRYVMAMREGRLDDAAAEMKAAVELLETLVQQNPSRSLYQFELADTLTLCNPELPSGQDGIDCREHLDRAVAIGNQLVATFPNAPEYQSLLATSISKLGYVQHQNGDLERAEENYIEAVDLQRDLADRFPSNAVYQVALAQTLNRLGDMKREWGQLLEDRESLEESRVLLTDAIDRFETFLAGGRDTFPYLRIRSALYMSLAETLTWLGNQQSAEVALRKARQPMRPPPGGPRPRDRRIPPADRPSP